MRVRLLHAAIQTSAYLLVAYSYIALLSVLL
jgi:hypothetical protein